MKKKKRDRWTEPKNAKQHNNTSIKMWIPHKHGWNGRRKIRKEGKQVFSMLTQIRGALTLKVSENLDNIKEEMKYKI